MVIAREPALPNHFGSRGELAKPFMIFSIKDNFILFSTPIGQPHLFNIDLLKPIHGVMQQDEAGPHEPIDAL